MKHFVSLGALLAAVALTLCPFGAAPASAAATAPPAKLPEQAPCAVCSVREGAGPEPVRASTVYEGKTYYFCQENCREEFLKNPVEFTRAASGTQDPKPKARDPKGATAVPT
jgi:YHS domain-containing protein